MPDNTGSQSSVDARELWRQWNDTNTRIWEGVLNGAKTSYTDPYGLYQSWLKTMNQFQEQMQSLVQTQVKETSAITAQVTEAWKQWFEMLEEAKAKLQTSGFFPVDPFTLYKQWYDATSETWAKVTEEIIGTEQFMDGARRFLDSYASFSRAMRGANEEYFHNLQLPTRSDIARVANLVIALEDKVDKLEDTFEDFADNVQQSEALQQVDTHLQVVESKTDAIQDTITKLDTSATLASLDKRLTQVESKLDRFLLLLEKIESKVGTNKMVEPRRKTSKAASEAATSNGFTPKATPSGQV